MHRCIVAALVLSARVTCGFLTDGQFVKKISENMQVKYMEYNIMWTVNVSSYKKKSKNSGILMVIQDFWIILFPHKSVNSCLRRLKRVFSHVHILHITWLQYTCQSSEFKFLVEVLHAKCRKWKCGVKSHEPEIKCAQNICFYLQILLGDPSCFSHTCRIKCANRGKLFSRIFCNSKKWLLWHNFYFK